jgi:hypothetical protein
MVILEFFPSYMGATFVGKKSPSRVGFESGFRLRSREGWLCCIICKPLIPPVENQSRAFFFERGVARIVAFVRVQRVQVMRKDMNLTRPRRIEARTERIVRR